MRAGIIADIIVAIVIIVNLIICTHRGFIRCLMSSISTILAFAVAVFSAVPLANFCENKFGWETAIAKWHVPFISAHSLLSLFVGVAVFIAVRLVCIIIDKILQAVKEKLKAVNVIDRILGFVFGVFAAFAELTFVFMLINQFGWADNLSLTADGGGYFAWRLFEFCRDHLFTLYTKMVGAVSDTMPKL